MPLSLLRLLALLGLALMVGCTSSPEPADLVLRNGTIYTLDPAQPQAEAVAVRDGKIIFVGGTEAATAYVSSATEVIDLEGRTMTPGLIEGHAHFMGLGQFKRNLDLTQVKSYAEMVEKVAAAARQTPPGQWILGRGWHQSKWETQPEPMVLGYQTHQALSAVSPDNPVFLKHASGHAAFVNAKAMEMAGIGPGAEWDGDEGEIIVDAQGNPTGVLTERAESLVTRLIPEDDPDELYLDFRTAMETCLENGITGFHDAGIGQQTIDLYQKAVKDGEMHLRMYAMLSGRDTALLADWYPRGPLIGDWLTIRSIKLYGDGALGSRGAWLLEPYSDRPGHVGNPITPTEVVQAVGERGLQTGFQVCTHAIGDRSNREVLDAYEAAFEAYPEQAKNARFRVEHAQHLDPEDIPRFAKLGVIPAMQAIHMSSDRPWAIDRLGKKRIVDGAYVWHTLIESGAHIVNGTDAPVEPVDPIACFFASVTRQTLSGEPPQGYEPQQKMTRKQALKSYTLWAAEGAFQEEYKGSIQVGKWADFTVFSQDLMQVPEEDILATRVTMTIVGGEVKYEREE